ncbi:MAG: NUDIX hydrolase [Roseburia sp.]|nr:NUDIX hydrolase [Roseburia sp.]MCM1242250.1 NUDIX hydrolase [Roseburia sp.]
MKPTIKKENVQPLFTSRFLNIYDLQYAPDSHYYNASRRSLDNLAAIKTDEEFRTMLPDAVSCVVIVRERDSEPKLLLSQEYRYPTGQFLLSPPAGLLDAEDAAEGEPVLTAARREIEEETGLRLKESDRLFIVNPLLFSSPGMTDESNALACAVVDLEDLSPLTQAGAVGSELFDGFRLLSMEEARETLRAGKDADGIFYSVFTWAVLMYFVSDLWR